MNFAALNARVGDLRHALTTQVHPDAMGEVGVRGPAGESDEAAFLRLTVWSFALLYEKNRVTIPFLLKESLPNAISSEVRRHKQARYVVQCLRSWLFHSLTAESEHDLKISRAVSDWFLSTCRSTSPQNPPDWERCFKAQCIQISELLSYCTMMVSSIAADAEDSQMIFDDLRRRLLRDWPPHQFDRLVEDAATRLGETISPRVLRDRKIGEWRKFLSALSDGADCEREIERVIDGDVANHFRAALPVPARELMEFLGLQPGPEVKLAIEIMRRVADSGIRDREQLLSAVAFEFASRLDGADDKGNVSTSPSPSE